MRFLGFLLAFSIISIGYIAPSYADSGWTLFGDSMKGKDFEPYVGEQKIKQRSLWDNDDWEPQDWIQEPGDDKEVMRDLYEAQIITGQYTGRKNIPVLEVGEPFIMLSEFDQYRVLQFVDYVFAITSSEADGAFWVYYEANKSEPLGLYNQHGFQNY